MQVTFIEIFNTLSLFHFIIVDIGYGFCNDDFGILNANPAMLRSTL